MSTQRLVLQDVSYGRTPGKEKRRTRNGHHGRFFIRYEAVTDGTPTIFVLKRAGTSHLETTDVSPGAVVRGLSMLLLHLQLLLAARHLRAESLGSGRGSHIFRIVLTLI